MYIHTNLLMCTYMPILFSVSNITQRLYNISSPTVVKLLFSNRIEKCISKAFNVTRCLIFFYFEPSSICLSRSRITMSENVNIIMHTPPDLIISFFERSTHMYALYYIGSIHTYFRVEKIRCFILSKK